VETRWAQRDGAILAQAEPSLPDPRQIERRCSRTIEEKADLNHSSPPQADGGTICARNKDRWARSVLHLPSSASAAISAKNIAQSALLALPRRSFQQFGFHHPPKSLKCAASRHNGGPWCLTQLKEFSQQS